MTIAFTKLPGLDSERLLAVVEPVLAAHHVDGVELIWKTDRVGLVLELTIERPGSRVPGMGITVDVCAEISRDLSAALDVLDIIGPRYQLVVGSPGVERNLYSLDDYRRFSGQLAKLKLNGPLQPDGPLSKVRSLRGTLFGVTEAGEVEIESEQGNVRVPLERITQGHLVFEMVKAERPGHGPKKGAKKKNSGAAKAEPHKAQSEANNASTPSSGENNGNTSRDEKLEH